MKQISLGENYKIEVCKLLLTNNVFSKKYAKYPVLKFMALWLVARTPDIFTPHTQREWGKVIGFGVHIYIYQRVR